MDVEFATLGPAGLPPADADTLQAAIALDPENPRLHRSLGVALLLRNDLDAAEGSFAHAAALDPEDVDARGQLAVILMARGRPEEGRRMLTELVQSHAGAPLLWANLAAARKAAGDADGAVDAYRKVLALQPDWAAIHRDLGATLHQQGRFAEALAARRRVAELQPDSAEALNDVAVALQASGELEEALAVYQRAAALRPGWNVPLQNAAVTACSLGETERAVALLRNAIDLQPAARPAHLDLGMMSMMLGDYTQGLREYEWRWPSGGATLHRPELQVPLWDGSPLAGRSLLLWCEQGFGDVLQFVRFAGRVPKDGGRIVLHAPKKLSRLLATCPGVDQVVTDGEWLEADVQFPLLSLPFALGITLDQLGETPYLRAPEPCPPGGELIPRDGSALNVGCVWASGPLYRRHRMRDCDVRSMAALSAIPGVRLFSMQHGPRAPDAEPYHAQIIDLSEQIGGFDTTAAFVERLDLIITVDTAMAHLAGALGKPVWLLLQAQPDWRWMAGRTDSPWYPTMRLYRQARPGDWTDVLERLHRDLGELACSRGVTPHIAPPLPAPSELPRTVFLKQYGERRTGTNYLRTLLTANYHAEVLMHILGDKHSSPVPFADYWDAAQTESNPARAFACRATFSAPSVTTTPLDLLQIEEATHFAVPLAEAFARDELRFVISIRDPYAWAASLGWFLGWSARGQPLPEEKAEELRAACLRFNQRHAAWLALAEERPSQAFFVRYEDLLADPETVCGNLARACGLVHRSHQWRQQEETVFPATWDNDAAPRLGAKFDRANDGQQDGQPFLGTACRDAVTAAIDWPLFARITARTLAVPATPVHISPRRA